MKRSELLSCLALLTLLCACAAPKQRPGQVESVLDVIDRAQAAESSAPSQSSVSKQCPGDTIPVCVSSFRNDRPVCSCGDPVEVRRSFEYMR